MQLVPLQLPRNVLRIPKCIFRCRGYPVPLCVTSSLQRPRRFTATTNAHEEQVIPTNRAVRNVAVIAHVDHGKTSLVDKIVSYCSGGVTQASMDSNPLEKERGITILAKCTSVLFNGMHFNIVDTPGHADFGGEVERVLSMVDGVLLIVDAQEGPMPQTKYVLSKALQRRGLKPIVVLNKCDRDGARVGTVENEVFDLFVALNASDEQLDFPIIYASAREGWAKADIKQPNGDMAVILRAIAEHIKPPRVHGTESDPFRMLVCQMDWDQYMGKLVLGRVASGRVRIGDAVVSMSREGKRLEEGKVTKLFARRGLTQVPIDAGLPGDIVQIAGLATPMPTCTVSSPLVIKPLYADPIDPPTISMSFGVNDSPLGGKEGAQLTSTMISDRLRKEADTNISLEVFPGAPVEGMPDATEVRARGELQLAILIENMRRERFELSVSPPAVLFQQDDRGNKTEPYEEVVIDIDEQFGGMVIERMALRKGEMREFSSHGGGKTRLNFKAPSRGLIGFQSELRTESRGTAVMHRVFESYGPYIRGLDRKPRAMMVSNSNGVVTSYAIEALEARGVMFVRPGQQTYVGHIIGECTKESLYDMDVNPVKTKKLTNIRAAGSEDLVRLTPPRVFSLEEAIVYVAPDELCEVTPTVIRLRKRILDAGIRDRATRSHAKSLKAS